MPNRLSLRLDISTKNLPSTRSIGGAHIQQNAVVLNLFFHLPTTWRSRMTSTWKHGKHDIQLLHGPRSTPTFSKSPVIPLEAHMRCGTSPETAATHDFFCLRIRWKKSEWYAGLSLWRWCRWWVTWAFTGVIQRHVLNLESMGQATSTSTYQITTDTTVNSLCFRLSHSKWPQVSKK